MDCGDQSVGGVDYTDWRATDGLGFAVSLLYRYIETERKVLEVWVVGNGICDEVREMREVRFNAKKGGAQLPLTGRKSFG